MNNKKIIIIIISVLAVLFVLFLGYKGVMYYRYTMEKPDNVKEIVNGFKNSKTITINRKELTEDEYVTNRHVKMKNILDGYSLEENYGAVTSYKKEENGKKSIISFGTDENDLEIIDYFISDDVTIFANLENFKGDFEDADRKGFLEKNNIKNDIDFYKFVANNYFIESNLFTTTKSLKQNYSFNLFTSIVVPEIEGWIIFEGDITGYSFHVGTRDDVSIYEIGIIKDGKRYGFSTSDPRFSDESFLIDVVSTIVIE